jgi:hypothetical protein
MPKRFENPIEIPPNVFEGLEAVRVSGVANMGDYASVQAATARLGYLNLYAAPQHVVIAHQNKNKVAPSYEVCVK